MIAISTGPGRGFTLRLGPFAVAVQAARVEALKALQVSEAELAPAWSLPQTPEEQFQADVRDAGRR